MVRRDNRHAISGAIIQLAPVDASTVSTAPAFKVNNISRGGIQFASDKPFELEQRIRLLLKLPNGRQHTATGRICYRDRQPGNGGDYYGISFLDHYLDISGAKAAVND